MNILIIKLGAKGDVVRTLPIAEAIKKQTPNSKITWVTKSNISDLLQGNPYIDTISSLPFNSSEKFDIAYNFDIEKEATDIIEKIQAEKKLGFYTEGDYASAYNLGAEHYLNTLFDDEIKRTNKKTYQEMMFEASELVFQKEFPRIYLNSSDFTYANSFLKDKGIENKKIIGMHMGAGPRWPSKAWSEEKIVEFISKCKNLNYEVLLFSGPDEVNRVDQLTKNIESKGLNITKNNPHNTNRQFAALINSCDTIVCSDSFALHVALALNKKTIAMFFCSPPNEVEGYSLLKKLVSPHLYDFFPEKMDQYNEELVNSISADEVFQEL